MNTHQRNVPATIDPTKLERLAETAVKVGLVASVIESAVFF